MSYTPNIPNASDARAESQGQILSNFQALNSIWSVNHTPLTNPSTQGQHSALTLRSQSGDPTTAANQVAMYNKLVSNISELFFRPASNGTPIQLTYPKLTNGTPTIVTTLSYINNIQQTFVAGPFIIYVGFITNANNFADANPPLALTPISKLIYVNANQTGNIDSRNNVFAGGLNSPSDGYFSIGVGAANSSPVKKVFYFAIGI